MEVWQPTPIRGVTPVGGRLLYLSSTPILLEPRGGSSNPGTLSWTMLDLRPTYGIRAVWPLDGLPTLKFLQIGQES